MSERSSKLSRRSFLLTVGAGGAAAATAAIVTKNGAPARPGDKNKRATRGYHATEHVNNYYRTTKV